MTLSKYALDYDKCTRKELRAFVKAKSWDDAETQSTSKGTKSYYVSKLRKLDRSMTFRFMDLPPEMRNLVYENLLIRDPSSSRSAFTTVLRTCRQVYDEAHGIFLAENALRLNVSLEDSIFELECLIQGDLGNSFSSGSYVLVGPLWSDTAVRLAPVHNFEIWLDFAVMSPFVNIEEEMPFAMHRFHRFFVQNCPNAKQVTVKLTKLDEDPVDWKPQLLEPLKSLPKGCKLRFEGLSEQQEADFWHMVGQDDH